jgi:hypothetical protein
MTEYDDIPTGVDEVLEDVHAARAEIEAIIDQLSLEQMTQATDDGGWTIKDHLAHIAEWQRRGLAAFEGRPPWEAFDIEREKYEKLDIDGINDILYQRSKDRPVEEVITDFRKTQEKVVMTLEQMNEDDLQRAIPESHGSRYRRLGELARSTFPGHDNEHVEDIRLLANQPTS